MTSDVSFTSAAELGGAYRAKRLSSVEVTQAALSAIEAHDATFNAFRLVDADAALAAARASEERWREGRPLSPIDGVATSMDEDDWSAWTPFSYPFNLTLQPAATVPAGFTEAGLPVGLQIVGGMYQDAMVLRAARAFEKATSFGERHAPI